MLDEAISVYILLQTQCQDEATLRSYISRLGLNLEVRAHGSQPAPTSSQELLGGASPTRNEDILWSGSIDTHETPVSIIQDENDVQSSQKMFAIWRMDISLSKSSISFAFQEMLD